jgi:hypothetical protein
MVLKGDGHSIAGGPYRDEGGANRSTPNPRAGHDMRSGRSTSTGTEQTYQARARQWSRSALRPTCCRAAGESRVCEGTGCGAFARLRALPQIRSHLERPSAACRSREVRRRKCNLMRPMVQIASASARLAGAR